MIIPHLEGRVLTKGHGAGNDFILVPDFEGTLTISPEDTVALCDRHRGIGADGLIRVVKTRHVPEVADMASEAEWMMDYRNADGSLAQMCGNGVRVFVHYLRIQGIIELAEGEWVNIATRGGIKKVRYEAPDYTVDMGPYAYESAEPDTQVRINDLGVFPARSISMPNPHTVVLLPESIELDEVEFTGIKYDPIPSEGTNLELVTREEKPRMRVLERGVGETLACGTGTCAVALSLLLEKGTTEGSVEILARGGKLKVDISQGRAFLTGPAVLVGEFSLMGIIGY